MKNFYTVFTMIILSAAMLLQLGCSFVGVRAPAEKNQTRAITIDEALSVKRGKRIAEDDFEMKFKQLFPKSGKMIIRPEISNNLPNDVAFRVQFEIKEDKYVLKILHAENAFQDLDAAYELSHLINRFISGGYLNKPLSLFEMYYNANEGHPIALDNFLKHRINSTHANYGFLSEPANHMQRLAAYSELRNELAPDITALEKQKKVLREKRKALMDELDKAPDSKQFKTLVAKGDRKGVADLLQKYLPFEDMAPFEKRFWNTYLEVVRNPVPLDQRVLIYRGLGEDFLHLAYDGEKVVEKEEALKEGKTFIMSTVLVKNQGSWNRRLRSLETMNSKYIATLLDSKEFSQSARISTMFMNHSDEPKGSPFLSFTPDFMTAKKFGTSTMMMSLIDPRLLHFNYVSNFPAETEFLLPLVTFPDEVAGFWHQDYHSDIDPKTHLDDRLKILIQNEYGKGKSEAIIKNIQKNSGDFFASVNKIDEGPIPGVPDGTMAAFYKKFAKIHTIKPAFTTEGNVICKDLLKLFWAAP